MLAASVSTLYTDEITRPDFSILYYPVITFDKEEYVEQGSRANLIGSEEYWAARRGMTADEYISRRQAHAFLKEHYSLENRVDVNTPPAFIVLGQNDHTVLPMNSILYYQKLLENGIRSELHIFEQGSHGFCFFPEGKPDFLPADVRSAINGSLERWLKQME